MKNLGSIASVSEFLQAMTGVHDMTREDIRFFCRGQAPLQWRLRPKIGRYHYARPTFDDPNDFPKWQRTFNKMFSQFEREYIAYHPSELTRRIDRLTLAQHYGLATQLLDWTLNPLVALYFACEEKSQTVGIVFFFSPGTSPPSLMSDADLERQTAWTVLRPRRFDQRMVNQDAVFTFHPDPIEDFGDALGDQISGVSIPAQAKPFLLFELQSIGIHRSFIFPGLESICQHIDAQHREHYSFSEDREFYRTSLLEANRNQSFDESHSDERPPYLTP